MHGTDRKALQPVPANLTADVRSFLQKYQPLSNIAGDHIGPRNNARFSAVGHCFIDFPCFSVEQGAAATIGTQEEITQDEVSTLLDQLTSSPEVEFKILSKDPIASGLKLTARHAVLEVVAPPSKISADTLAGMVFDMFKMQQDNPTTNSIRAVQAQADGQPRRYMALCLYPDGANSTQAHDFCLGNKPDGTPAFSAQRESKRDLIDDGLGLLCGFLPIPGICS